MTTKGVRRAQSPAPLRQRPKSLNGAARGLLLPGGGVHSLTKGDLVSKFIKPSDAGDYGPTAADLVDCLALLWPTKFIADDPRWSWGAADTVEVRIVVLDDHGGPLDGEPKEEETAFYQGPLVRRLRKHVDGGPILGRFRMGAAKRGQSAPYLLEDPSEADERIANDYLEGVGDG
jgi:hypothetical protein